ncbi:hypothetical protein [Apilactobacillus kunkeei]
MMRKRTDEEKNISTTSLSDENRYHNDDMKNVLIEYQKSDSYPTP